MTFGTHSENLHHRINPHLVGQNICPLCHKELISSGRLGIGAHLRKHIQSGELKIEDLRQLIEDIVAEGKLVRV